jgi:hypothetical protein
MHTQFIADRRLHCIGGALTWGDFLHSDLDGQYPAGINKHLLEGKVGARVRLVAGRIE